MCFKMLIMSYFLYFLDSISGNNEILFARAIRNKAVYMFLNVCRKILAENVNIDKIPDLLIYANEMLAILEKDMPITIQVRLINTLESENMQINFVR